jgi:hypothetical protein
MKPRLVAEDKSKPLMPLLLMTQVHVYLSATSYRGLGHHILTTLCSCRYPATAARRHHGILEGSS